MTELEQALLKALKKQDEELESVHKRIEHQQQHINHLTGLVEQLSALSTSVDEQLNDLQPTLEKLAKR
jgi:peptidoglycan hydrolase CwlO-like protein